MNVLKRVPAKGSDAKEAFTPEVREAIANYMMPLYGKEWTIGETSAAFKDPRSYITGKKATDLLQHWTVCKSREPKAAAPNSTLEVIKQALKLGLITEDQAHAKVLEMLK